MKRTRFIIFATAVFFSAFLLMGQTCNSMPPASGDSNASNDQEITPSFNVKIVRVNYLGPRSVTVISSVTALERHFNIENLRQLAGILSPHDRLLNVITQYNDDFFKENILVIAALTETSGSIRHEVERIDPNGSIVIKRFSPMIGTSDMAGWNIFIEINNNDRVNEYKLEFIEVEL